MLPKHSKRCAYHVDSTARCTCSAKFNGKPFSHWQDQAAYLVVDALVRAYTALGNGAPPPAASLPAHLAALRLQAIAQMESSELKVLVEAERDRFMSSLGKVRP